MRLRKECCPHEIRQAHFSDRRHLRIAGAPAALFPGAANRPRVPAADYSSGVLLRFRGRRCCMATRFHRDVARPGALPAADAGGDGREGGVLYSRDRALSATASIDVHAGRRLPGWLFGRSLLNLISKAEEVFMENGFSNIGRMFKANTDIINKATLDVANEDWYRKPGDDSNNLVWVMGHV